VFLGKLHVHNEGFCCFLGCRSWLPLALCCGCRYSQRAPLLRQTTMLGHLVLRLVLVIVVLVSLTSAQIVTNGDFEAGTALVNSGWSIENGVPPSLYFTSFMGFVPQSGQYFIGVQCLPGPSCSGLEQTISLVAGRTYRLTAYYTNDGGGPGQDGVTFIINSNTIAQFGGTNYNNVWQQVTATFVAPPPPTALRLRFYNTIAYSAIDNISIVEQPLVPFITVQPSSQSVAPGASATFSFSYANLQGATNQWFVSIDHGASFKPIPNANALTFVFAPLAGQTSNYDGFQFFASASLGGVTLTTNIATISIIKAPMIVVQPQDVLAVSGSVASFNVTATAQSAIVYQWQVSSDSGLTWSNVVPAGGMGGAASASWSGTSSVFQVTASPTNQFQRFRVQLTSAGTSLTTTSSSAVLRVAFITVSSQPSSVTVTEGQQATFSVAFSSFPPSVVVWKMSGGTGSGSNGAVVDVAGGSGAQSASFTTVPTQSSMSGVQLTATISNGLVTASAGPATLTVNRRLAIVQQPQNVTVSAPSGASFSVTATGSGPSSSSSSMISFLWQVSSDGGQSWSSSSLDQATVRTASLSVPSSSSAMNQLQYRVLVSISDELGTTTITSSTATLSVLFAPTIVMQAARPLVVVSAQDLVTLAVAVEANPAATYQWQSSQVNSASAFVNVAVDGTGPSYRVVGGPERDSMFYRAVCSNSQGIAISNVIEVRIEYPRNSF